MFKCTKRFIALGVVILMLGTSTYAMEAVTSTIEPQNFSGDIIVNDVKIDFGESPLYINGHIYVPVRPLVELLQVDEVIWLEDTKEIYITKGNKEILFEEGSNIITMNNQVMEIDDPVISGEGKILVPLRLFALLLGAGNIAWDEVKEAVIINQPDLEVPEELVAKQEEVMQQAITYSEEDVYWLARIVEAEAKNEPYEGKVAVANVVLNRVESDLFPNSIYAVIFDNTHGVQFTPTINGTIYNEPKEECIQAAREALEGYNNIGESLYFAPSRDSWAARNRTYYTTISGHYFYL